MKLSRLCAIVFLLLTGTYLGCYNRIDEVYNLPTAFRLTDDIYLGQSLSYLEHNGQLQYDRYCDCYSLDLANAKRRTSLFINKNADGNTVQSLKIEYGCDIDFRENELLAYELIDTLIREYGENYLIVDYPAASLDGHNRPKLLWHTNEGVEVSIAFIPFSLFETISTRQVVVMTHVDVEFRIIHGQDLIDESTQWTREALGLE